MEKLNRLIDHTLLNVSAKEQEFILLLQQAKDHDFFSVCVPPCFVKLAHKHLNKSNTLVGSVVGFPSGLSTTHTKVSETIDLIKNGAQELDMVINLSWVKDGYWQKIFDEIKEIKLQMNDFTLKVIVESSLLTKDEILNCCLVLKDCGADYIKTSSGLNGPGARLSDVIFMKQVLQFSSLKIKASGGIKTKEQAIQFINAGASRLGTSSGLNIIS